MELRRWNDILAMKNKAGEVLAFHSSNMEVAEISEELWGSMNAFGANVDSEAFDQLSQWNSEISSEVRSLPVKNKIQSLSINVTQICNLHCVYCAAGGDGSYGSPQKKIAVEKTLPQLQILMDRLSGGDFFGITFLGGEPLLYPEGMRLIAEYAMEKAREKSIQLHFSVITNGTMFNEQTLNVLKGFHSNITISLDGPPEINDQMRPTKGGQGSTAKVVEGLRLLNSNREGLGKVGLQGVFGPHNPHVLKAYKFYSDLNVDWFDFHYDQESSSQESSEQFVADMDQVAALALQKGGETELRKIKFFDTLFAQMDSKSRMENYCGSGKSYLVLDAQNNAFTCPWAVNDKTLKVGSGTDLAPEKLQPLKNSLISTNNCGQCWAKYLCGGGCMWAHKKATGNQHQASHIFCERTRSLISLAISYYYQLRKT